MTMTRRRACGLAAGALGAAGLGLSARAQTPSLDALARAKGLRFGSAIASHHLRDAALLDVVRSECGVLVSENEHKGYTLHNRPDGYDFERPDALVAWAESQGLDYRGHTLLWHRMQYIPAWVKDHDFGPDPAAEAERMLTGHIETVIARYPQIRSWDVVNETVDDGTGAFRDTVYTEALGPDVIDIAFHAARAAAPDAQLVYNDYMSWDAPDAAHRDGVLRLLEAWLSRGVPVDALGVQSHLRTAMDFDDPASAVRVREAEWRRFMDAVTGMGLKVLITEFDVSDQGLPADIARRDAESAAFAKAYLDMMFDYPQTEAMLSWGIADHQSWLQGFRPREDGLPQRPLPYDSGYRPKPMRDAIAAAFRAAPAR